ncbi:MAG: rhomboid family intramembrane serine protease [Bryobacterales bacterium]|nr:rhomboid family intramembrane serine protease [Bryobacterales bacterium]
MIPIRDSQPSYSKPVAVLTIIIVNTLVFLYQISLSRYESNFLVGQFGFVPDHFSAVSLITSMFMHGGWMHIIGNMLFLWVFGDNIEDILGKPLFVVFYLACGIIAALTQYAIDPDSTIPMIGASGAIAGVMGAYMVKFPHARVVTLVFFFFITTIELPAVFVLAMWFVLQFFSGVGSVVSYQASRGGTAFFAHIGGFVAGMVLIKLLKTRPRYQRRADLSW